MAKNPQRHHFIPQMILRHFADDNENIWFWRRGGKAFEPMNTSTKNVFVEKDLYTLTHPDGTKDVALKTFFSRLEGAGAQFIVGLANIVRDNNVPHLDPGAWHFWHHFFYYHLKRTPGAIATYAEQMGFQAQIDRTVEQIRELRLQDGMDPDEPGLAQQVRQNAIVIAQRVAPSPEVLAAFNALGLAIYKITDPRKSFIIGDVPGAMARFPLPNGTMSRPTLFLPVTWDIALGQTTTRKQVEIVEIDRDQARRMNAATTARSNVIAGRSSALLRSLATDVPYVGAKVSFD